VFLTDRFFFFSLRLTFSWSFFLRDVGGVSSTLVARARGAACAMPAAPKLPCLCALSLLLQLQQRLSARMSCPGSRGKTRKMWAGPGSDLLASLAGLAWLAD
jgi:hypothetical protein